MFGRTNNCEKCDKHNKQTKAFRCTNRWTDRQNKIKEIFDPKLGARITHSQKILISDHRSQISDHRSQISNLRFHITDHR